MRFIRNTTVGKASSQYFVGVDALGLESKPVFDNVPISTFSEANLFMGIRERNTMVIPEAVRNFKIRILSATINL